MTRNELLLCPFSRLWTLLSGSVERKPNFAGLCLGLRLVRQRVVCWMARGGVTETPPRFDEALGNLHGPIASLSNRGT
jgi:hypothetical protein